ncbi:hypothetical protein Cri9333_1579 [Crinalium epipsammum PCC 9333]|uniref:Uncharacterized protein n=1 Tax=Crinalium epipsammum PCC 9333 TaxID=1173022 RepID=K9VY40_9CYAN|nr:hypothetical protein Cri9333_1579 [Crinalium epipsammum PCC 9333]
MIFVDTGAWFASVVPSDSNHQKAVVLLTKVSFLYINKKEGANL